MVIKIRKKIPFTIKLTGCGGVNHLITKLTSQYVSPYSNSMLADINNAQRGFGVQIYSTNDIALIPNDANSYYSVQDSSTPDTCEANFYAVLSDDGKGVITTGAFKAIGTFIFDCASIQNHRLAGSSAFGAKNYCQTRIATFNSLFPRFQ
ncbi:fimbrial protein [Salmonella enterica]|nr:hypothetical protein [Salmonella enterica]EBL8184954.1 hypothetical protein [Salmonella enterica]EJG3783077.1 fimbrial protein [Salmonella enterica]EJM0405474.1 fimbrial protein [Salmonella enterica]EKH2732071.1 fimbrial protein [Salmonella enterica]